MSRHVDRGRASLVNKVGLGASAFIVSDFNGLRSSIVHRETPVEADYGPTDWMLLSRRINFCRLIFRNCVTAVEAMERDGLEVALFTFGRDGNDRVIIAQFHVASRTCVFRSCLGRDIHEIICEMSIFAKGRVDAH